MATCKDCLHLAVCYLIEHYGEDADVEGVETDCSAFADRSKYVVREKGEWKRRKNWPAAVCTECSFEEKEPSNFCPNCGSDMRKGENDG